MPWEDLLISLITAIIEGVILAVVLGKWSEIAANRRIAGEVSYVMNKFLSLYKNKQSLALYYFVKLLSDEERKYLKRVLLMDINFTTKKGSTNEYADVMEMKNEKFIFVINPEMPNYHRLKNMKMENTFDFQKPEELKEIYTSFETYIQSACKEFGVALQ